MGVLEDTTKLHEQFKTAISKKDVAKGKQLYDQLKIKLIQLPACPPTFASSPTAQQELLLARDILEHAVLLCLRMGEEGPLERSFVQLKQFYADTRSLLPPSPQEYHLVGLNLLRLLVENRIAEFHTELELIPDQGLAAAEVAAAVQLEQWLMEGAYNKVLAAKAGAAGPDMALLLDQLARTVREEIASCSEVAYDHLTVADAQKVMMCKDQKELVALANKRGWSVEGGLVRFQAGGGASGPGLSDEARLELIHHSLAYAKELERIV